MKKEKKKKNYCNGGLCDVSKSKGGRNMHSRLPSHSNQPIRIKSAKRAPQHFVYVGL